MITQQNISKVNIPNHNYSVLPRNKELTDNNVINNMIDNMDNMIDKDFNQQLEPTTRYGYNTLINFSKFEYLVLKSLTVLSKIYVINLYY